MTATQIRDELAAIRLRLSALEDEFNRLPPPDDSPQYRERVGERIDAAGSAVQTAFIGVEVCYRLPDYKQEKTQP